MRRLGSAQVGRRGSEEEGDGQASDVDDCGCEERYCVRDPAKRLALQPTVFDELLVLKATVLFADEVCYMFAI